MKLILYQVDAFTNKLFAGNPAAVIPLDEWIEDQLMQNIAMENNLSETVFFVKNIPSADKGQKDATYHIRWFTPDYEIDLCGHATLASAHVIKNFIEKDAEQITFTTQQAGLLKVIVKDEIYTLDFPSRMPIACEAPNDLLKSLGVPSAIEILRSRDYFVVLPNEEAVTNVKPDFITMQKSDTIGVIVTAIGQTADVVSRCFYPGAGIAEDPVTGSAHCNIVPYWSNKLGKTKLFCKQLSSRGGELHCELKQDRVLMSGQCVFYMKGEISIANF